MHLAIKFNESFKTSQGNDFELRMYAANAYGCNAVCYNHMEKLHAASNDSVTPSKKMGGL